MTDIYNLNRFIEAQASCYEAVLNELKAGQKQSHWMWFIFPQIQGLGLTATAQKYALSSRQEAAAYAEHPVLGARLNECTQLVLNVQHRSAEDIFHYPDYLKFRSCMTLFAASVADDTLFENALQKYFDGVPDPLTLAKL